MAESISQEEAVDLSLRASKVFQPRAPITARELFAGRWVQITTIADAVGQPGLHIIIYGERGVGKTSLANIVRPLLLAFDEHEKKDAPSEARLVVKINANKDECFSSIWNKLFAEFE